MLIHGMSTIFIYQMPTYLVFKKSTFYTGIRILKILPCILTILKNEKAKFKVALRKYLNTHSFYSVDEFLMYKDAPQYCFIKCL
jgi:hypothetical protein